MLWVLEKNEMGRSVRGAKPQAEPRKKLVRPMVGSSGGGEAAGRFGEEKWRSLRLSVV